MPKSPAPVGCYPWTLLSLLDTWLECRADPACSIDTLHDACQPGFLAVFLTETVFLGARAGVQGDTCGCPPLFLLILPFMPDLKSRDTDTC